MYRLTNFIISRIKEINIDENIKNDKEIIWYFYEKNTIFQNGIKLIKKINDINFRFKNIQHNENYFVKKIEHTFICQFNTINNVVNIFSSAIINIGKRIVDLANINYYDEIKWVDIDFKPHRETKEDDFLLPAYITNDKKVWFKHGKMHNDDMKDNDLCPAYKDNKGVGYYIDGIFLTHKIEVLHIIRDLYTSKL